MRLDILLISGHWGTTSHHPLLYLHARTRSPCRWESIWGIFNQLTDYHAEMLRRMATVLRSVNGGGRITGGPAVTFRPHVPFTLQDGVFATEFENQTHRFYTLVNRDALFKA